MRVNLGTNGKRTAEFNAERVGAPKRYLGSCERCHAARAADIATVHAMVTAPSRRTPGQTVTSGAVVGCVEGVWRTSQSSIDIAFVVPCVCGSSIRLTPVRGTVTAHECDPRCMDATGPRCECSCGGANHGGNYLGIINLTPA